MDKRSSEYIESLSTEGRNRLRSSLGRTLRGFETDLVSPLLMRDVDPTLARETLINALDLYLPPTGLDWLDEAEAAQRDKIGPYSIMLPFRDRLDSIMAYFAPKPVFYEVDIMDQAWRNISSLIAPNSLRVTSIADAFKAMPKGTNLGLPWLSRDKSHYPSLLGKVRSALHDGVDLHNLDPAMLYWRGQPRGLAEIPKQRVVWGFPHWVTVLEEMIQFPLLDILAGSEDFSAWISIPAVDSAVTRVIDMAQVPILSVDFSSFDQSVPEFLIRSVFNLFKHWFSKADLQHIKLVEDIFLTIGLMTPDGIYRARDGAIPSGSALTNMVGTLAQRLAFEYVSITLDNPIVKHLAQGDDGVVLFSKSWEIDDVSAIMSNLNLNVSSDKGGVSSEMVMFLQNLHHTSYRREGVCVHVRPLYRVYNGMMSYERLHDRLLWNKFCDSIRWWQQLESAKYHPNFRKAVYLLFEHDYISRQYGPREVIGGAGGLDMIKSLLHERSFPYGKESLQGLFAFDTVQTLAEYRRVRLK